MVDWRSLALDPPRAFGPPLGSARMRSVPEDFQVDERLGFEPSGAGEHLLVRVRKRGANTAWVARELARIAGVRPHDVGYAGLKDRHAVTTQWFSLPARRQGPAALAAAQGEGWQVLEAHAHRRKLPRGALAGNEFRIVLRGFDGGREALERRVEKLRQHGVPNYFGPQRFGRELANLVVLRGSPPPRDGRGFVLSAARSLIFNAVLAERVREGTWNRLLAGERANLDGRNSNFLVEASDTVLEQRTAALDLHPTGPLWGEGDPGTRGAVAAFEQGVADRFPTLTELLRGAGLEAARRPLRMAVPDLTVGWLSEGDGRDCELRFSLRAGSFATVALRELMEPASAGDAAVDAEEEHG
ncbi:MAG: tRNA pseudouridine(13) synthase TruD [Gammaproteobacteria bacterium]